MQKENVVSEKRASGRKDEDDLGHIELGSWAGETGLKKLTMDNHVG